MSGDATTNEVHCIECGEQISERAEICPECGVRQPNQGGAPQRAAGAGGRGGGNVQQGQSYGLVFAFVDSWKYQRPLRHLLNIGLIFVSFGTYLGVLLIEGLIHYRNLNNGNSVPYDEAQPKVWTTFTNVQ